MKKSQNIILLLLMTVLMICLAGCGKQQNQGTSVEISYLNKSETQIVTEEHYLEGATTKEMIVEVLTLLCSVPENKELKATLSGGINIINYSLEGEQVTVSLGEKYKELSRTTEVLTRAALVRSLTEIPGVTYVMITVGGEPLTDLAGNALGIMTADMFVDNEGEQMNSYEKVTIRLYFANESGDSLIPINRELVHNIDVSNISMEKLIVEQLIAGPANDESYPTINPQTKLLGVTVKDGICYVNLDSSFLTPVNNVTSDVTIYSIANSLVELSNVNKVQISIDGKKDIKFRDKYNLTTIFERNLQLVQ
mgnify:FL=1